jgi:hypothetical protein
MESATPGVDARWLHSREKHLPAGGILPKNHRDSREREMRMRKTGIWKWGKGMNQEKRKAGKSARSVVTFSNSSFPSCLPD